MCIFQGATSQRYLQEAIVVKGPRHHLDEFIVIVLANLFELSAPIARIQMQSDLDTRYRVSWKHSRRTAVSNRKENRGSGRSAH